MTLNHPDTDKLAHKTTFHGVETDIGQTVGEETTIVLTVGEETTIVLTVGGETTIVLTVGGETTIDQTVDTHARRAETDMTETGIVVLHHTTIEET